VPRLVLAPRALDDLDRLADFLLEHSPALAASTGALIVEALDVLKSHPLIGRPVEAGLRELLISRGRTGYVALYRYQVEAERVLVLAIRHQRESAVSGAPPPR
jgi:plasmid stabilization system protein ParE